MGSSASYQLKPQELNEFRKLNNLNENLDLPERPEYRVFNDKKWLLVFGIAILILFPFLIYTLVYSDIRRLAHTTDNCGNVCGYANEVIEDVSCSGKNYTQKPYAQFSEILLTEEILLSGYRECVQECHTNFQNFWGICHPIERSTITTDQEVDVQQEVLDVNIPVWNVLVSIVLTIVLSMTTLLMFRYATAVIVWGVLVFSISLLVILTGLFWYWYVNMEGTDKNNVLYGGIVSSIATIGIIVLLIVLRKKIRLVILLYKEATKAVFAIPAVVLIPIVTLLVELLIVVIFGISTIWMSTSGVFTRQPNENYAYVPNGVMIFSLVYNLIITFWSLQFIVGCQYMVIAGSISTWYFAKNKKQLESPIWTSLTNTLKFHLGSVALGSLVITIVAIVKAVLQYLAKNDKLKWVIDCCMSNIEQFIKFLSKNAYIETALHGQTFFKSGKRAAKLLLTNATSLIAVNSVGDFVLGMVQVLVIAISTGLAYLLLSGGGEEPIVPTVICAILNVIIVTIIFAVFETTVDTLFICFCEDKVLNDGISKPYCMSKGLMEFVDNSMKVYNQPDAIQR